jgi:hypothetical protein
MTTYKSKIGLVPVLAVGILLGGSALLFLFTDSLLGFAINLLLGAMVAFLFTSIRYIIEGPELKIRFGLRPARIIRIADMLSVQETNDPLASPAASFDRLRINTNDGRMVLVSPAEKEGFIQQLVSINPRIEVKPRYAQSR